MRRLIVGVDPGTTVGWAVLDLKGKVVELDSAKHISLDALIAKITKLGTVIVVGCDKAKTPSFVQDFATKFHAKVISPRTDILVSEKRALTKEYEVANAHEMDALSSALLAYRKVQPLLRKIFANLKHENKQALSEDVSDLVIRENLSIHAALTILEPEEILKEEAPEQEERDTDVIHLFSSLKNTRRESTALRTKNDMLSRQLQSLQQRFENLKAHASTLVRPKSAGKLSKEKEARIHILSKRIEDRDRLEKDLHKKIQRLEHTLLKMDDDIVLPRLRRLSGDIPKLVKDAVVVDDPNEFSEKFINELNRKGVTIIVFRKPPSKTVRQKLPFVFIQADNIMKEIFDSVAIIDKSLFNAALAKKDVLKTVVHKYKKARSSSPA